MENVIGGALKLKKPIGGISKCVSVSLRPWGQSRTGKPPRPLRPRRLSRPVCRGGWARRRAVGPGQSCAAAWHGQTRPVQLSGARPHAPTRRPFVQPSSVFDPPCVERAAPAVRVCTMSDWLHHDRPLFTRRWLWRKKKKSSTKVAASGKEPADSG
jgi:hypothetical protein